MDQQEIGLGPADFTVEHIDGLVALPEDILADPACPAPLAHDLFGPVGEADLPCYAVLDAARIRDLPEQLAASRLPHRCLFKGAAAEEMGEAAPWLVELSRENAFTRALFTAGDVPWLHWGRDPGVFLRSGADFDSLWGHLRKFTRCPDERGRWVFFKFWEPTVLRIIADLPERFPGYLARYGQIMGDGLIAKLVAVIEGQAHVLSRATPQPPNRVRFTLPPRIESRRLVLHRQMCAAAEDMFELGPPWVEEAYGTPRALSFPLRDYIDFCLETGIESPAARADLMETLFCLDHPRWPGCLATSGFARIRGDRAGAEARALDWMYRVRHDVAQISRKGR